MTQNRIALNINYKIMLGFVVFFLLNYFLISTKLIYTVPFLLIGFPVYYIIYKYPIAGILLLMIVLFPTVFMMTPNYNVGYSTLGFGIRAEDIILVLMGIASIQKMIQDKHENKIGFEKFLTALFILFFIDIIRNVGSYGISSFGEFRFDHLMLVLPIYIALFFDSIELRRKLFLMVIFVSLSGILLSIPVIGLLKGWSIGYESRFLPSKIELGLVYSFIALVLYRKYNVVNVPLILILIITIPIFILFIGDGHRSVWLATSVMGIMFYMLGEYRIKKILLWSFWIVLLVGIVYLIFVRSDLNLIGYIRERALAFTDPRLDPDSYWRLAMWGANINSFLKAPIFGQGYGGYWNIYVPVLGKMLNLPPHNLYVQLLVKIGLVGLTLYIIIVFKLFRRLKETLSYLKERASSDLPIVIFGLAVLVSAQAYYFTYSFEYYSLLYIGIAAAAVLHFESAEGAQ